MKIQMLNLATTSILALMIAPHAEAAACSFKLIEEVPVVRVTLATDAKFDWDDKSDTRWDANKVIKTEKLNGNRFQGSFQGLTGLHSGGNVAIFQKEVIRAEGTIEFSETCSTKVFSDGFCNVKTLGEVPSYAVFKSLDRATYRKSVKDPRLTYMISGQMNSSTSERRILLSGYAGEYPPMRGGGGTINVTLAKGQKSPAQRLAVESINDALWYELGDEEGEAGALGPRVAWLDFVCEN